MLTESRVIAPQAISSRRVYRNNAPVAVHSFWATLLKLERN